MPFSSDRWMQKKRMSLLPWRSWEDSSLEKHPQTCQKVMPMLSCFVDTYWISRRLDSLRSLEQWSLFPCQWCKPRITFEAKDLKFIVHHLWFYLFIRPLFLMRVLYIYEFFHGIRGMIHCICIFLGKKPLAFLWHDRSTGNYPCHRSRLWMWSYRNLRQQSSGRSSVCSIRGLMPGWYSRSALGCIEHSVQIRCQCSLTLGQLRGWLDSWITKTWHVLETPNRRALITSSIWIHSACQELDDTL